MPHDSLLGQGHDDSRVIVTLRAVEAGRERIIVRKDGIVLIDLLGEAGTFETPILNGAQEALVRDADLFHNHPLGLSGEEPDSTFSPDDLYFARRLGPARTIVVAQTFLFEAIRPPAGWRRALGNGSAWEREFRGFLALELAQGRSLGEARHQAWVRLFRSRRIIYRMEGLD